MKKAQVTLFVIIGIVILAVVGIALFLITKSGDEIDNEIENIVLEGNSLQEKLNYVFEVCVDHHVNSKFDSALKNFGYLEGTVPENLVSYNDEFIITTYDRDYPDVFGIENINYLELTMESEIENRITSCVSSTTYELTKEYEDFDVYLEDVNVEFFDGTVVVEYNFSLDYEDKLETFSNRKVIRTNLQQFIRDANIITQAFVDGLYSPDFEFNYQMCLSTQQNYGFRPRYPLDILTKMPDYEYADIILAEDFFIVTLNKNSEEAKFAIKPYFYPPACS